MNIRDEFFILIEKSGSRGMSALEISNHTGWPINTMRNWLSRWCKKGYLEHIPMSDEEKTQLARDYILNDHLGRQRIHGRLKPGRTPGTGGRYAITNRCKWWGEQRFDDTQRHFD